MQRAVLFVLMITATSAMADVKGKDGKTIECYCTDTQGLRVELGDQICLRVDGRAFMAQCDMSLNVPIWRDTGLSCLSSSLPQSRPVESVPHFLQPTVETNRAGARG